MLETQSSVLGTVIEEKQVQDLPLSGRNFVQLATLSPGVSGAGSGMRGTIMSGTRPDDLRPGTELFVNGNRENSNNYLYDGIDNNTRLTLVTVLRPNVEAIQEFKVQRTSTRGSVAIQGQIKSSPNPRQFPARRRRRVMRNDKFARTLFANRAAMRTLRSSRISSWCHHVPITQTRRFFRRYDGFARSWVSSSSHPCRGDDAAGTSVK